MQSNSERILVLAPTSMYGSGIYAMESVKQIKITEEFSNLRPDQQNCQTLESHQQCINHQLLVKMEEKCGCLPFELSNFSDPILVSLFFEFICSHA